MKVAATLRLRIEVENRLLQSAQPDRRAYSAGEKIPQAGIYRVVHYRHRLPHLVTISLENRIFPYCRTCEHRVLFEPTFEVEGVRPTSLLGKENAPECSTDSDLRESPSRS